MDLVISVIAGDPGFILGCVASRFEIEEASLSLLHFGPEQFLLILPGVELVERVLNDRRPIITLSLRLHVMRWTRFLHATAASLPVAVEINLRGIPAHAWELATVAQLLNDHCWISEIHPTTLDRRDVFTVIAWCSHPGLIPQVLELEILEPLLAAGGSRPVRRTLVYPISVSVALVEKPMGAGDPPVPPEAEGDRRGHRQDRSPRAPPARAASVEPRASVHARLGPLPVVRGHVVDAPSPA